MTDVDTIKKMLARIEAKFEEEDLRDVEGVIEVRAHSKYEDESCEVVFVFDREGALRTLHVMDPTKS